MKKLVARAYGLWLNVLAILWPKRAGKLGFVLFCHPIRVPMKKHHREYLSAGASFVYDYDGVNVQVYRWGTGATKVLLLHGWQSHTYRWKAYIDSLLAAGGYTIYSLDAPGHGLSGGSYLSLPYYSELIERILKQIGPVHSLVGHSLGGFSTLYTFYRVPALSPQRLVLMGTPGEASDFLELYRNELHLTRRADRVILDYFMKVFEQPPSFFSAKAFAPAMAMPGLIIHDEDDPDAPFAYAKSLHAAWPHSSLVTTKGLGHNLRSQEVVRNVVAYLDLAFKEKDQVQAVDVRLR